jgi:hypothetical protein
LGKWLQFRNDREPSAPLARMQRFAVRLGARLRLVAPAAAFAVALFAAAPAHAQFSWTFTKSASPTTYSTVGQVITYSYVVTVITNSAGTIFDVGVTDNKVAPVTCPKDTLVVGESMTCTGTYVITAADVAAGSVTNIANARGNRGDGDIRNIQATATITFVQPTGTITIVKQGVGGNNTFNFASSVGSAPSFTLTTGGGAASRVFSNLVAGTYTFAEINLPTNWALTSLACFGDSGGAPTVPNVANGSVSIGLDGGESITCTFTNTFTAPPPPPLQGSITIIKQAIGGDNTFNFTSTAPGAAGFALTTSGGLASRIFTNLASGTYTFTEVGLPLRWQLTALSCIGDNGGSPTVVTLSSRSVSIGLDAGEAIVCTFTNAFDRIQHVVDTQDFIKLFLTKRIMLLAGEDTDRTRFFRRIPGAFWGEGEFGDGGGPEAPINFSGVSSFNSTRTSFSTSLSQINRSVAAAERRANPVEDAFAAFTKAKPRAVAAQPGVDVWVEAHYNNFWSERGRLNNGGNFGVAYIGADILATRSILVGALAQFDWIGERSVTRRTSADGNGYFVGPYIAARLTQNVFFDARAAWGRSDNRVNPFGLYEDGFSTTRWLARANLTGNWQMGQFRFSPGASVIYVSENQHNYIDTLGIAIPSQTVSLGRLTFGPEVSYRFIDASGASFEPLAALKASWDFAKPGAATVGGYIITQDDIRLAAQLGLMARFASGQSWRVVATYDGIGSRNLQSVGGQFWVNIPLHAP